MLIGVSDARLCMYWGTDDYLPLVVEIRDSLS